MSKKKDQLTLGFVDDREVWEREWKDMPEYSQKDMSADRTLYFHFRNKEDVEKFSKLIGQKIHPNEKSYWYPEKTINEVANKRYINEDDFIEKDMEYIEEIDIDEE